VEPGDPHIVEANYNALHPGCGLRPDRKLNRRSRADQEADWAQGSIDAQHARSKFRSNFLRIPSTTGWVRMLEPFTPGAVTRRAARHSESA